MRPVSNPFSTSNSLAKACSKPNRCLSWLVKNVNPPDTSTKVTPYLWHSCNKNSAPSLNCKTRSYTVCRLLSDMPLSSATRLRSDCSKSNSPRMARSVISATCSFSPACAAISSIHSIVMSVLSMSLTINLMSPNAQSGNTPKSAQAACNSMRTASGKSIAAFNGIRAMLPLVCWAMSNCCCVCGSDNCAKLGC